MRGFSWYRASQFKLNKRNIASLLYTFLAKIPKAVGYNSPYMQFIFIIPLFAGHLREEGLLEELTEKFVFQPS